MIVALVKFPNPKDLVGSVLTSPVLVLSSPFDAANHGHAPHNVAVTRGEPGEVTNLDEPPAQVYEEMARSVGMALRGDIPTFQGIADWLINRYIRPYSRGCHRDRLRLRVLQQRTADRSVSRVEPALDDTAPIIFLQSRVRKRLRAFKRLHAEA